MSREEGSAAPMGFRCGADGVLVPDDSVFVVVDAPGAEGRTYKEVDIIVIPLTADGSSA